jgi:hypothetical protein
MSNLLNGFTKTMLFSFVDNPVFGHCSKGKCYSPALRARTSSAINHIRRIFHLSYILAIVTYILVVDAKMNLIDYYDPDEEELQQA